MADVQRRKRPPNRASGNAKWKAACLAHPPGWWRSRSESRVIQQLTWQWWICADPGNWPLRKLARVLGVQQHWIQCLIRRFQTRPARIRAIVTAFGTANFDQLERAREETRRERARGRLQPPLRYRRVTYYWEGKKRRVVLLTKTEMWRRVTT